MEIVQEAKRSVSLLEGLSDLEAASQDQRSWAEDQLARLNLWAKSLGVFAEGTFSIEHRLSENAQVATIINQLLTALSSNAEYYRRAITREPAKETEASVSASVESGDDTSSTSTSEQSPEETVRERGKKVQEGISRLVQLAIRLRREGAQKSDTKATSFEPKNEAGETLVPEFERYITAICQRALNPRWDNVALETATVVGTDQPTLPLGSVTLNPAQANETGRRLYHAPSYLHERLKKTMVDRWRRVSYRGQHAMNLAGSKPNPIVKNDMPKAKAKQAAPALLIREPSKPQITKAKLALNVPVVRQPLSAASVLRPDFKIDAKQDLHPKSALTIATKVRENQLNFPRAPTVRTGIDMFNCLFCGLPTSTKLLEKKRWESHVMQDLAPYFCLVQDCEQPRQTFRSSEEWLDHTKRAHARSVWTCQICHEPGTENRIGIFDKIEEFVQHEEQFHSSSIKPGEIAFVAETSCHKEMPIFDNCLFCGFIPAAYVDEVQNAACQKEIREHMCKTHMQYFALASLPWDIAGVDHADSGRFSASSTADTKGQELKREIMEDPVLTRFDTDLERQISMTGDSSMHQAGFYEFRRQWPLEPDIDGSLKRWHARLPKNPQQFEVLDRKELLSRWLTDVLWANGRAEVTRMGPKQEDASDYLPIPEDYVKQDRRRSMVPGVPNMPDIEEQVDEEADVKESDYVQDTLADANWLESREADEKAFLELVGKGDAQRLSMILGSRPDTFDIQCTNEDGLNAIHLAILAKSPACIKILADAGCDVNCEDWEVPTPLYLAAIRKDYAAIEALLEKAANLNEHTDRLGSKMHAACIGGNRDIVELLLDRGCKPDSFRTIDLELVEKVQAFALREPGSSDANTDASGVDDSGDDDSDQSLVRWRGDEISGGPMIFAAHFGHADVVKLLIDRGAPIDSTGNWIISESEDPQFEIATEATALHFACKARQASVVHTLLDSKANLELKDDLDTSPAEYAALAGSLECLQALVMKTSDEEKRRQNFGSALHLAAGKGWVACVRFLLENGIAADARDTFLQTPLMFASASGHDDVIIALLDHGATIDSEDDEKNTPLFAAVSKGQSEAARMLLARGACVDHQNEGQQTPLMLAAEAEEPDCLRLLLDNRANVELRDSHRLSALSYTTWSNRAGNARILLGQGVSVELADEDGWTPLSFAAEHDRTEIVTMLIERGASLEHRTQKGNTPLLIAAFSGSCEVIRMLIDHGADLEAKSDEGNTALLQASRSNHAEALKLLLDRGCSIETENNDGETALSASVNAGHIECLHVLIEAGASPGDSHRVWELALVLAAKEGNVACLRLLLSKTSSDSSDDNGSTALMVAASEGHKECARLLLDSNAAFDTEDGQGMRAIHYAAQNARPECLSLLLERDKDKQHSPRDRNGKTPLLYAAESYEPKRSLECVRILLEAGALSSDVDKNGRTALWLAVHEGHQNVIEPLVTTGVDLEAHDNEGFTLLMCATFSHFSKVDALIKGGADVDARHAESQLNALAYSSSRIHNCETTVLLLKAGSSLSEVAQVADGTRLLDMRKGLDHLMTCFMAKGYHDLVQLRLDEIAQALDKLQRERDPVVALTTSQKERVVRWADDARSKNQAHRKSKKVSFAPVRTPETEGEESFRAGTDDTSDSEVSSTSEIKSPSSNNETESLKSEDGPQSDAGPSKPQVVGEESKESAAAVPQSPSPGTE